VRVTAPPGWVPADTPPETEFLDGDLVWETVGSGRVELPFRLAEVPASSVDAAGRPLHPTHVMFGTEGSESDSEIPSTGTPHVEQRKQK
jgi:hypothetical protein